MNFDRLMLALFLLLIVGLWLAIGLGIAFGVVTLCTTWPQGTTIGLGALIMGGGVFSTLRGFFL